MNIEIICIGKLKDRFFEEAAAEYAKRIGAFGKLKITEIPAAFLPENPQEAAIKAALQTEAAAILKRTEKTSAIYPLCIEGELLSSEDFAAELQKAALKGNGKAVFVIGGSYGLAEEVKAKGTRRISMSPMTFPHRLARIMLLEQIYRAFTIQNNRKYHK